MKPRKATKGELESLKETLRPVLKSGDETPSGAISNAAIAVFDQIESPNFPHYGNDEGDGKLMVCDYMVYPPKVETYRWEDGKWIDVPF